jgi:hypothetical protein
MNITADRFRHLRFERSKTPGKKYDAIIEDHKTRKTQRIPFGNIKSSHYQDTTGLKLYSHLDNHDEKLKDKYFESYRKQNNKKYSPEWYSLNFLWS